MQSIVISNVVELNSNRPVHNKTKWIDTPCNSPELFFKVESNIFQSIQV